ncbi:YaiI/YqxD family protein [Falsibacillus albus]|uniref:UPF0178 protein D9X91_02045 n=1 Tax=Falsibacillus albus TaxID=2478915 RepID=A0A3L7K7R2_9BACI|nr:DUF188 domain-containing protein [Falsibacillus albus]RLQ98191.1 DUF188 domain-containing protein [Falsibacillus albus]
MIYVDADACPVKAEIVEIARKYQFNTVFVASIAHKMNEPVLGEWVYVDADKESADLYIINHIQKMNVVITQDIGLAGLLLPKDVYVLSPRGIEFKEDTIEIALNYRYAAAKARRQGKYGKGPKPFLPEDRLRFSTMLTNILSKIAGDFGLLSKD